MIHIVEIFGTDILCFLDCFRMECDHPSSCKLPNINAKLTGVVNPQCVFKYRKDNAVTYYDS